MAGTPNAERRRLTRDERREHLLARASAIFGEFGYHNVSMDDVAEAAGISKALLYQHFSSKDDLYLAVLRVHQLAVREVIALGADSTATPADRLWRGLLAFFEFVERNRSAWGVLYRDSVAIEGKITRGIHSMRTEIAERIAVMIEQAIRESDLPPEALTRVSPIAHALVGTAEALADYWLEHPEETKMTLALTAMNLVWTGFGGLLDGEVWVPAAGEHPGAPADETDAPV